MSGHEGDLCGSVGRDSENRDELWPAAVVVAAQHVETAFSDLARRRDDSLERELQKLELLDPRGPFRHALPDPSAIAKKLATRLATASLEPLRRAFGDAEPVHVLAQLQLPTATFQLHTPAAVVPAEARYGLPLVTACSIGVEGGFNVLDVAARWLVARQLKRFEQIHVELAVALSALLELESDLWRRAAALGGRTESIPYAYRLRALGWFWSQEANSSRAGGFTLCVRCGCCFRARASIGAPPRCAHCAKEPPEARAWPAHAIAPAGRGDWWLECQTGCGSIFRAPAQARRCNLCRSSHTTPRKRQPLNRAHSASGYRVLIRA